MAQNTAKAEVQDTTEVTTKANSWNEDVIALLPFDSSVDGTVLDPDPASAKIKKNMLTSISLL